MNNQNYQLADLIKDIVNNGVDWESDTWERVVYTAYWMGREEATKYVSDDYDALLAGQKERAKSCRYYNMAMAVQGNVDYIYHDDYRQDIVKGLALDPTDLQRTDKRPKRVTIEYDDEK